MEGETNQGEEQTETTDGKKVICLNPQFVGARRGNQENTPPLVNFMSYGSSTALSSVEQSTKAEKQESVQNDDGAVKWVH